jgi:hypothetical protein
MARFWQSGFETGEVSPGMTEWDGPQNLTNFSLDTSIVRSGNYSGRFDGQGFIQSRNGNMRGGSYARYYLRFSNAPTYWTPLFEMKGAGDTPLLGVVLKPVGTPEDERKLELFNTEDGFRIGLSTTQLNPGEWYCIEVLCGTPGGSARLKINGILEIQETIGNGWSSSSTDRLQFGCRNANPGCTLWFDDCAWNVPDWTAPTGLQNAWCGPGSVLQLVPDQDGSILGWIPANGGAQFAEIDDLPGGLDPTTYISATSLGQESRFRFPALSAPLGVNTILFGVRGGSTMSVNHKVTGQNAKLVLVDSLGHLLNGPDANWLLNGSKSVFPILSRELTWDPVPVPLTDTYVNGLEAAAVVTGTSNKEIRWSALWLSVDVL